LSRQRDSVSLCATPDPRPANRPSHCAQTTAGASATHCRGRSADLSAHQQLAGTTHRDIRRVLFRHTYQDRAHPTNGSNCGSLRSHTLPFRHARYWMCHWAEFIKTGIFRRRLQVTRSLPGHFTVPGFEGCLNWRWLPRCLASFPPSLSSVLITFRTFTLLPVIWRAG